jgi:hypothetical protein
MVPVTINGITDPDGDPTTVTITSIFQDEPVNTKGDGSTAADGSGVGTSTAMIRAERTGSPQVPSNRPVDHISFTVNDGNGGSCSGTVQVKVPQRPAGNRCSGRRPLYEPTQP